MVDGRAHITQHPHTICMPLPGCHKQRGVAAGFGATLGGVLGSILGGPVGAAVGGSLGSVLGVVAGEQLSDDK